MLRCRRRPCAAKPTRSSINSPGRSTPTPRTTPARIDFYRHNPVSVRVRVIDPDLASHDRPQPSRLVWGYLARLPEEVQSDISSLLLLAPAEAPDSFANHEFDDPTPSDL